VLIGFACVIILLATLLALLSARDALPPGARYVPAQIENGRIIAGHAAP